MMKIIKLYQYLNIVCWNELFSPTSGFYTIIASKCKHARAIFIINVQAKVIYIHILFRWITSEKLNTFTNNDHDTSLRITANTFSWDDVHSWQKQTRQHQISCSYRLPLGCESSRKKCSQGTGHPLVTSCWKCKN